MLTPNEAAELIGCSPSHCRALIRQGKIRAKIIEFNGRNYYRVTEAEALRFKRLPVTETRGFPRGMKRTRTGRKKKT